MKTLMTRWFAILALSAAALAGCDDRSDARPVLEARTAIAPTPAALRTASSPGPQAPSVGSPIPVTVAATTLAASPKGPTPVKAAARSFVKDEDAKLKIKRLVLAQGVSNREPVDPGTSFDATDTERIYAFVEIENEDRVGSEVSVTFVSPDGKASVGNVTLDVGPQPRWRTWAYTRGARQAGTWTAVVRSMSGKVLARAPFEITK